MSRWKILLCLRGQQQARSCIVGQGHGQGSRCVHYVQPIIRVMSPIQPITRPHRHPSRSSLPRRPWRAARRCSLLSRGPNPWAWPPTPRSRPPRPHRRCGWRLRRHERACRGRRRHEHTFGRRGGASCAMQGCASRLQPALQASHRAGASPLFAPPPSRGAARTVNRQQPAR